MSEFFKVKDLSEVLEYTKEFSSVGTDEVQLGMAGRRVLAEDIVSDVNLPDFTRSTMDGFAVSAASTYGATEGNPAYLSIKGSVAMGESPDFSVNPGEAAGISTGGMLPDGTDAVVMIEHTEAIDETMIEVYKSVAPGQHTVESGEDYKIGETLLSNGRRLRPQEIGLLAAFGRTEIKVHKKPIVGIISTGDEVIPINETPGPGMIRDINTFTLSSMVLEAGGLPERYDIVKDDYEALFERCSEALSRSDMVLVSGGSSVGMRDFTIEVLSALPDSNILVHGISISPGKPTILAKVGNKAFWGLPGHVTSAMVVFSVVVKPFMEKICGFSDLSHHSPRLTARLNRNLASAQGRIDYARVRLFKDGGELWAEPILGKSGLINTMVKAEGLVEIGMNDEGLDKNTEVPVIPLY